MGTETWIISLPLSDSILYLKIIHPPNFREEPFYFIQPFLFFSKVRSKTFIALQKDPVSQNQHDAQ